MDEEATTYVFDASQMILGRLASHVAKILIEGQKTGSQDRVIVVNAENAVVSGSKKAVFATYRKKYELNHARKGPFFHECLIRFSREQLEVCYLTRRKQAGATQFAICV